MKRTFAMAPWLLAFAFLLGACSSTPADPQGTDRIGAPSGPVQLSSDDTRATFELENTSDTALDWRLDVANDGSNPLPGDWFDVTPVEGRLQPYGRQLVTLTQRSGLEPGSYRSRLDVVYEGGSTSFEVVGQVSGTGSPGGDASIAGYVTTPNADLPIRPPGDGFSVRSSRSAAAVGNGVVERDGPKWVPGELVVGFEPGFRPASRQDGETAAQTLARGRGAVVASEDREAATAVLQLPAGEDVQAAAAAIAAEPGVRFAEPNYLFFPHAVPNDPYVTESWQLPVIGAPLAWEAPSGGERPVVAVIDSGIDIDHEDLQGIFVSGGYDFCSSDGCASHDSDPRPDDPFFETHGTHVTGLLAAVADNGRGIAGVANGSARVLPIKVFRDFSTTASAVARAIRWAAGEPVTGVPVNAYPADIITLSLGSSMDSTLVREAVATAVSRGVLVIASAGNQGHGEVDYPARYSSVVGVGAINSRFERSCFSDYGTGLDIMAPGGDGYLCDAPTNEALLSTFPQDDYGDDAGTSMAAPIVAGAAALVWANLPAPDAEQVREALLGSAYFDDSYMSEATYGSGILRLDAAVGFPGPGDAVAVTARGPTFAEDTVTLDLEGFSEDYRLAGLAAGSYSVEAEAAGNAFVVLGSSQVAVAAGEDREPVVIRLGR